MKINQVTPQKGQKGQKGTKKPSFQAKFNIKGAEFHPNTLRKFERISSKIGNKNDEVSIKIFDSTEKGLGIRKTVLKMFSKIANTEKTNQEILKYDASILPKGYPKKPVQVLEKELNASVTDFLRSLIK